MRMSQPRAMPVLGMYKSQIDELLTDRETLLKSSDTPNARYLSYCKKKGVAATNRVYTTISESGRRDAVSTPAIVLQVIFFSPPRRITRTTREKTVKIFI